ncbi:hypothetical protein M378DRAFT_821827 [Amanita muscaria Koide BX008]|uniref:Uncharacterized protein n=1 Tax=Amanita muscaria (strain Koide BX008) TaxID=946122 RepID=A0A0C2SYT3_AMAMK|nr:hypothetical protein M378DRAFT_821827 [Amanita muscaria Koide BX008]
MIPHSSGCGGSRLSATLPQSSIKSRSVWVSAEGYKVCLSAFQQQEPVCSIQLTASHVGDTMSRFERGIEGAGRKVVWADGEHNSGWEGLGSHGSGREGLEWLRRRDWERGVMGGTNYSNGRGS